MSVKSVVRAYPSDGEIEHAPPAGAVGTKITVEATACCTTLFDILVLATRTRIWEDPGSRLEKETASVGKVGEVLRTALLVVRLSVGDDQK